MPEVSFSLSDLDSKLLVRITTPGTGRRGGRRVFSINFTELAKFEVSPVTAQDQRQLDKFFAEATEPKVEAAVARILHIYDGSG
jgi:hypothetical protein